GGAGRSGGAATWGAASLRAASSRVIRVHVVVCALAGSAVRGKPKAANSALGPLHESPLNPLRRVSPFSRSCTNDGRPGSNSAIGLSSGECMSVIVRQRRGPTLVASPLAYPRRDG